MATQILPQAVVFQEYAQVAPQIVEPLRALIVGPDYHVEKYTDSNLANVTVGSYAGSTFAASFPSRDAGDEVDASFTKVYVKNAELEYYDYAAGGNAWTATSTKVVSSSVNLTNANGYTRNAALPRNVAVGDLVEVSYGGATLRTTVTGLTADIVAASVAPSAVAEATNTVTTVAASSTAVWGAGASQSYTLAVDASAYDGLATGDVTETYTVRVLAGGDVGTDTVTVSITSASGNDNVASVALTETGGTIDDIALGSRGAVLSFGSAGVTLATNDVIVVTAVMDFTSGAIAAAGTYTGTATAKYLVEILVGGTIGTSAVSYRANAITGIFDVSTGSANSATPVAIGTQGVTIAFANTAKYNKGDKFVVTANAAGLGPVRTLVVADTISATITAGLDINVKLLATKEIELEKIRSNSLANWTQTPTSLEITADAEYVDAVLGSTVVTSGEVYVEWRGVRTANVGSIKSISDVAELSSYFKSNVTSESVLAYGVSKALANANGTDVRFVATAGVELQDWTDALELTLETSAIYGLVPLTDDRAVKDLFAAHVASQSSPEQGRWRVAWFSASADQTKLITSDSVTGATVLDYPEDLVNTNILVEATNGDFIDNGVRAGDVLRIGYTVNAVGDVVYDEYVVDSVINNERLLLVDGPALPIVSAERFEVWRNLTSADKTSELILDNSFASKRVRVVLPGVVDAAEGQVSGFFLAAALAGLRSGVVPHQGLTNVAVAGFTGVTETKKFTRTQLDQLANAGYWIVTQDVNTGAIYTRKQLTSDISSIDTAEDSVVATDDAITYAYASVLAQYIGRTNVTASNISLISSDLDAVTAYLKQRGFTNKLGGLVVDASVREIRPHSVFPDRLVAVMDVTRAAPLNNLELYLVFSFG